MHKWENRKWTGSPPEVNRKWVGKGNAMDLQAFSSWNPFWFLKNKVDFTKMIVNAFWHVPFSSVYNTTESSPWKIRGGKNCVDTNELKNWIWGPFFFDCLYFLSKWGKVWIVETDNFLNWFPQQKKPRGLLYM